MFFSATQDIAIDAYRTDVPAPSERGLAAAATNLGYRPAAWLASARRAGGRRSFRLARRRS